MVIFGPIVSSKSSFLVLLKASLLEFLILAPGFTLKPPDEKKSLYSSGCYCAMSMSIHYTDNIYHVMFANMSQ